MVKILRLKAKGFKQLDIDNLYFPEKGTVLIVGKNESGKSTLFEAIYFALFGKGLVVGPEGNISLISYSQDEAEVELDLALKDCCMTIRRRFNRKSEVYHYLEVKTSDGKEEIFEKAAEVNNRILKEIGLDSDSLLNSCFVEQKNLEKIENISPQQREKAIARLLNLDGFIHFEDELKDEIKKLEEDLVLIEKKKELITVNRKLPALTREKDEIDDYLQLISLEEEKDILVDRIRQENSELKYLENDLAELDRELKTIAMINLKEKEEKLFALQEMKKILANLSKKDSEIKKLTEVRDLIKKSEEEIFNKEKKIQELTLLRDELGKKKNSYEEAKEVKDSFEKIAPLILRLAEEKKDLEQAEGNITEWMEENEDHSQLEERLGYLYELKENLKQKISIEREITKGERENELNKFKEKKKEIADNLGQLENFLEKFKEKELLDNWGKLVSLGEDSASINNDIDSIKKKINEGEASIDGLKKGWGVIKFNIVFLSLLSLGGVVVVFMPVDFIPLFVRIIVGVIDIFLFQQIKNKIDKYGHEIGSKISSMKELKNNLIKLESQRHTISSHNHSLGIKVDLENLLKKNGIPLPISTKDIESILNDLGRTLGNMTREETEEELKTNQMELMRIEAEIKAIGRGYPSDISKQGKESASFLERRKTSIEEVNRLKKLADFDNEELDTLEGEIGRMEKEIEKQEENGEKISLLKSQLENKQKIFLEHREEVEKELLNYPKLQQFLSKEEVISVEDRKLDEILLKVKERFASLQDFNIHSVLEDTSKEIIILQSNIKQQKSRIDDLMKEVQDIIGDKLAIDFKVLEMDISIFEDERIQLEKRMDELKDKLGLEGDSEKIITQIGFIMKEIEKDRTELDTEENLQELSAQKNSRFVEKKRGLEFNEKRLVYISERLVNKKIDKTKKDEFLSKRENLIGMIKALAFKKDELRSQGISLNRTEMEKGEEYLDESKTYLQVLKKAREILTATRKQIFENVLPRCEINMSRIIPLLTADKYIDVRIDPVDYRLEVFDDHANEYIPKKMFSGGTKDQFSLALRLSFALATLPEERGATPSFIFLDEPISAFDEERKEALIELITQGELADAFDQIFIISHFRELEGEFTYRFEMVNGRVKQYPSLEQNQTKS